MTDQSKIKEGEKVEARTGLDLLRAPFPPSQISKLPKEMGWQVDARKANKSVGIKCKLCGNWHHKDAVHLDYVGHAALTDRLLDADPMWNWEPVAVNEDGTPKMDQIGGMWIRLTVCGMTRLGYGDAEGKKGPNAVKEVIGDALRNAAMRFGAALDLWHKGDLHAIEAPADEPTPDEASGPDKGTAPAPAGKDPDAIRDSLLKVVRAASDADDLNAKIGGAKFDAAWQWLAEHHEAHSAAVRRAVDEMREKFEPAPNADLGGDTIPF